MLVEVYFTYWTFLLLPVAVLFSCNIWDDDQHNIRSEDSDFMPGLLGHVTLSACDESCHSKVCTMYQSHRTLLTKLYSCPLPKNVGSPTHSRYESSYH